MPRPLPDPDETVAKFALELAKTAVGHGWIVGRTAHDGSDRAFSLHKDASRIDFVAKLSQSEQGFWGLQDSRASEMRAGNWHLVLLTAATRGYVIRTSQLESVLSKASRVTGGFRINERNLRHIPYSTSIDAIWKRL